MKKLLTFLILLMILSPIFGEQSQISNLSNEDFLMEFSYIPNKLNKTSESLMKTWKEDNERLRKENIALILSNEVLISDIEIYENSTKELANLTNISTNSSIDTITESLKSRFTIMSKEMNNMQFWNTVWKISAGSLAVTLLYREVQHALR